MLAKLAINALALVLVSFMAHWSQGPAPHSDLWCACTYLHKRNMILLYKELTEFRASAKTLNLVNVNGLLLEWFIVMEFCSCIVDIVNNPRRLRTWVFAVFQLHLVYIACCPKEWQVRLRWDCECR